MKVHSDVLSNIAWARLDDIIESDLSLIDGSESAVDEAQFLLELKRALFRRNKRITLTVTYPKESRP